jgi:hypothetical protein
MTDSCAPIPPLSVCREAAANTLGKESFMKTIPEKSWRLPFTRISRTWSTNHWLIAHRAGLQGQQTQNANWAAAAVEMPYVPLPPATAAARVGPKRRQRAAENDWENEGGTTQPPMRAAR